MEKAQIAQSPAAGFNSTGTGIADADAFGEGGEELVRSPNLRDVGILKGLKQ